MWRNILFAFLKRVCNVEPVQELHVNKKIIPFFSIAFTVTLFNLIAIFGPDILLHDDPMWYTRVLEGKFPKFLLGHFSPLYAYKEWLAWNIMAYSPCLARGLYVLFLMVPISCCFYYLYHVKFGFPRLAAFSAAVLPNILPALWEIPAGINMSYTLWGLLFAVFSLIFGLHYLEKTTPRNCFRLFAAVILYLLATLLMEQSVFLFPPIALIFWGYARFKLPPGSPAGTSGTGDRRKMNKKYILPVFSFFIIAAAKFIHIILMPRKQMSLASIEEILERIGLYFKWSLPVPDEAPFSFIFICLYIAIIIGGFIVSIKDPPRDLALNKNFLPLNKREYILYIYSFFFCWSITTMAAFIIFGGIYFQPRYTHISAFGINALLVFSFYMLLNKVKDGKLIKKSYAIFLVGTVFFSGALRFSHLEKKFNCMNEMQAVIVDHLKAIPFPENSQVVIAIKAGNPGVLGWHKSSGYLKYALKRDDISGLIGRFNHGAYYNFDIHHFDPEKRGFFKRHAMTGLRFDQPVFFFIMNKKRKELTQLEYTLHWKGKTKIAPWSILHADKKTGKLTTFLSGTGWEEYLLTLKKLKKRGILQPGIFWGGPPGKQELERLERLELDPRLFRSGFLYDEFNKIEPSRAKQFLAIPASDALAANIYFGKRFRLVLFLLDEVTNEDGTISNIAHILWKSRKRQFVKKFNLSFCLFKKRELIWSARAKFCQAGSKLSAQDYIFGSIKIPEGKLKQAGHILIKINDISNPGGKYSLNVFRKPGSGRISGGLIIPVSIKVAL